MFIDGLSDSEKHNLAQYLREQEHTPFMVIKHAHAAAQCERRGLDIHPIDLKYLKVLDLAIESLYGKQRVGPGLAYDEPRTRAGKNLA
ncbi:hypothetical protein [Saccharospirillum salsuginis]|uniref:Uncharacterized protein n=1 Tax=Saccharospirillum salsuginis TaxID=418750 RepID=A0A918K1L4_9GAMM|nr:hypothetical protein [Saccharospirillum salsuginis]GGX41131.1 hypothetical protein GCM10007392_04960 [Saccharospirillum salsuginis]